MKHKIKIFTILAVFAGVLLALWIVPTMIHNRIERELRHVFQGGKVSIGRFSIEKPLAIAVSEILIDGSDYQLTVQKASIDPALNLTLSQPRLELRTLRLGWPDAQGKSAASRPALRLNSVLLRDLTIDFKHPLLTGEIRGSVDVDMGTSRVRSAHLEAPALTSGSLQLKKIILDLPVTGAGVMTIEQMNIGKLAITGIRGDVLWEDTTIRVYPIAGSWIRGSISGQLQLLTENTFDYDAEFQIQDLDLTAFSEQMELNKKMTADGKVTGRISVNGNFGGIRYLRGSFASDAAGGNLIIQDPSWLKYLAQNTRQRLELVESAFKEYHFDTAAATMAASGKDLKFAVRMNGAKGRRDFEVNLHDQL